MFCEQCGNVIEPNSKFCMKCGAPLAVATKANNLLGFSPKINDPAFLAYKKKSKAWSLIFAFILAVIAMIAFPIYGNYSGDIDFPNSLFYGMGLGGMFILIAVMQTIKRGLDKTWDGVVKDKKTQRRSRSDDDGNSTGYDNIYIVKINKNAGGTKKHKTVNSNALYNYYNIGDAVRHHKGFLYYEKYDKSKDTQILCAACSTFNDINTDFCKHCKCPLLK